MKYILSFFALLVAPVALAQGYPSTYGTANQVAPTMSQMPLGTQLFVVDMRGFQPRVITRTTQLHTTVIRAETARENRAMEPLNAVFAPAPDNATERIRTEKVVFQTAEEYFTYGGFRQPSISDFSSFASYRVAMDIYRSQRARRINHVVENSSRPVIE